MIDLLSILIVFGTSLWVLVDSRDIGLKRGTTNDFFNMGPTGWFVACLLCWIVAFPVYLVKRHAHMRAVAVDEQAQSSKDSDFVSQLDALVESSKQGLLTTENFRTKRLELVSRILEEASQTDFMSQLSILADLSTQNFLTDEEFQARKKELVHRMLLAKPSDDTTVLTGN